MASISEQDEAIIQQKPLAASLDSIRPYFKLRDENLSDRSPLDDKTDPFNLREAISTLLATLQIHPVARNLRPASLRRPLNGELASLYARIQSEDFDLSLFTPLTVAVADNVSDLSIWQSVLQLIVGLSRVTPPPSKSIPSSYLGTLFTRSSASFQDSTHTRTDLEEPLRIELSGCTFENVDGFWAKYFKEKEWSDRVSDIYKELCQKHKGDALLGFPDVHSEEEVWEWLSSFQELYLGESPGKYFRTKSKKEVTGAQGERQIDLFVKSRSAATETHNVYDISVIGELTSSEKSKRWMEKFIQLATYMRDVFSAQPTRRFVHGFIIFAAQMQLWVFDRSGAYSSDTFDIRKEPQRFIHAIVGYAMMTDEDLGLGTFVQRDGQHTSITITDVASGKDQQLKLEASPFTTQRSIVSRGTTCYRTADGNQVVKFSWRSANRRSEPEHLSASRGVPGIAKLNGSRDITSIAALRDGLTFSKAPRKLVSAVFGNSIDPSKLSFTSQSAQELESLTIGGTKRSSDSGDERAPKRSRSQPKSSLRQEVQVDELAKSQEQTSTTRPPYRNRILTCLAVSPAGRSLSDFTSVREVLTALRDAIKAHRSLFLDAKILHRDVSLHNIILTDANRTGGHSGMLIDLDLAISVEEDRKNRQTEACAMTGTLEYLAIEILEGGLDPKTAGIGHTYRHDLESFFYVFLSVCIRYGWENGKSPTRNPLRTWYTGSLENISRSKRGDVEPGGFEIHVLTKFSPKFQCVLGLARTLRDVLFSKGVLFTGTPVKPNELYNSIIHAFDEELQNLEW
jgi:hypothetical protein